MSGNHVAPAWGLLPRGEFKKHMEEKSPVNKHCLGSFGKMINLPLQVAWGVCTVRKCVRHHLSKPLRIICAISLQTYFLK